MKTQYEYIHFEESVDPRLKTRKFLCINSSGGSIIGIVKWFGRWRQYAYFPTDISVYSVGCLKDIGEFIGCLMKERQRGSS